MNLKNNRFIKITARVGFIAKGFIYFTTGLLALLSALGMGGSTSGSTQILEKLIYQPFGYILLIICTAGLLAHAFWRVLQGLADPEKRGNGKSAIIFRAVDVLTGFIYLSLSYAAYQILSGAGTESGGQKTKIWIAQILTFPFGRWIVLALAVILAATGIYQFYAAYKASFEYSFDRSKMNDKQEKTLRQLGRIGFSAWGIVYLIMAFLFTQAAIKFDANEAGGLGDALNALAQQPYGAWVMGITSAGLLVYGIYVFILSYYHQIYRY